MGTLDLLIPFKDTKTRIQFKSFDTRESKAVKGIYHLLNEANHIPLMLLIILMIRLPRSIH
jgi:hypothetical protein